jgi:hypothetical protein
MTWLMALEGGCCLPGRERDIMTIASHAVLPHSSPNRRGWTTGPINQRTLGSTLESRFELGQYDMADGFGRGLFLWFIGPVVLNSVWTQLSELLPTGEREGYHDDCLPCRLATFIPKSAWVDYHTEFSTALVRAAPSIERAKRSHPVVFDRIHHTWQTGEVVE